MFKKIDKKIKKSEGFALLFSVLLASLLLTIGLSIFNIALKELAISGASRQSIHAYYAAASGLEEAKYLDLRTSNIDEFDEEERQKLLTSVVSSLVFTSVNKIPVDSVNSAGPNYNFTITKVRNTGQCKDVQSICTIVESTGHDSDDQDKVERAMKITY